MRLSNYSILFVETCRGRHVLNNPDSTRLKIVSTKSSQSLACKLPEKINKSDKKFFFSSTIWVIFVWCFKKHVLIQGRGTNLKHIRLLACLCLLREITPYKIEVFELPATLLDLSQNTRKLLQPSLSSSVMGCEMTFDKQSIHILLSFSVFAIITKSRLGVVRVKQ